MLTKEENELLTRVGPGTPMGNLFRRFWLPALHKEELSEPDGAPVPIRLLGENLVAFRDTDGKIAFLEENCPHRGASLFLGRNEECGLRCVYHGWKFDVEGNCVDMPSEPAEYNFKDRIKATAYPGREWGGMIWVYMGPPELKPELPELEWCLVPDDQRYLRRWVHDVNYAQALEGDIDTAHVPFLHRRFATPGKAGAGDTAGSPGRLRSAGVQDLTPKLEVKQTDYGFAYGGRRDADGLYYWRVTQMLLPSYSLIPAPQYPRIGHCYVPIDDEHTLVLGYHFHAERPLTEEELAIPKEGRGTVPRLIPGTLRPVLNRENQWQIDREMQRTVNYSGIPGITEQDLAVTQSMGPRYDRSREHLGTSDVAVIFARKMLMQMALQVQEGIDPYAAYHGSVYRLRSLDTVTPIDNLEGVLKTYSDDLLGRVGPVAADALTPPSERGRPD